MMAGRTYSEITLDQQVGRTVDSPFSRLRDFGSEGFVNDTTQVEDFESAWSSTLLTYHQDK